MPTYDWICECGSICETVMRVLQVTKPENHPRCAQCGKVMRRDYRAEHSGLADSNRNKGLFPMQDENLTGSPDILVESQQHRRRLMREQKLYEREASQAVRERLRDAKRRFY